MTLSVEKNAQNSYLVELLKSELEKYIKTIKEHPDFNDNENYKWLIVDAYVENGEKDVDTIDKKIKMHRAIHWHLLDNGYLKLLENENMWKLDDCIKDQIDELAEKIYEENYEYINSELGGLIKEKYIESKVRTCVKEVLQRRMPYITNDEIERTVMNYLMDNEVLKEGEWKTLFVILNNDVEKIVKGILEEYKDYFKRVLENKE